MLLILGCTFLFVVLVVGWLNQLFTWKERRLKKRLKQTLSQTYQQPDKVIGASQKKYSRFFERFSVLGNLFGERYLKKIQTNLVKAGVPLKAEEIVGISILFAILLLLFGYMLTHSLLLSIGFGVLGLGFPYILVTIQKSRRTMRLEVQLLNAVVMLSNALRSGHSFLQALEMVSRESPEPLSDELTRTLWETKMGVPIEQALINLNSRVESKDLEMVITGVLIQRQVGGNLAELLDGIAKTIDKRFRMRAKIKTLTAQGRFSAWIVSLLPVGLAIFVFGMHPEFAQIMLDELIGRVMLGVGAVFLVLGILVIRKVVNIDV